MEDLSLGISALLKPLALRGSLEPSCALVGALEPVDAAWWRSLGAESLDGLLSLPGTTIFGWEADAPGLRTGPFTAEDAAARLRAGTTLYVHDFPAADGLSTAIARELRLPTSSVRTTLFVSEGPYVTPAHFDPVDTVAVQLQGSKLWTLHANSTALEPMVFAAAGRIPPNDLLFYTTSDFQFTTTSLPEPQTFELTRGAAVVVPRGTWHRVISDGPSVSLHVHVSPTRWLDVVLDVLHATLARRPEWRVPSYALFGDDGLSASENMLRSCAEILLSTDPQALLARTGVRRTDEVSRWARSLFATLRLDGREADGSARVTLLHRGHRDEQETKLALAPHLYDILRAVDALPVGTAFSLNSIELGACTRDEALNLMSCLMDARFIESRASVK